MTRLARARAMRAQRERRRRPELLLADAILWSMTVFWVGALVYGLFGAP